MAIRQWRTTTSACSSQRGGPVDDDRSAAQLVAKPRPLPLRVLPGGAHDHPDRLVEGDLARQVGRHLPVPHRVHPSVARAVSGLEEPLHLARQTRPHHRVDAPLDPPAEDLARHPHQEDGTEEAPTVAGPVGVPPGERSAGQQGDGDPPRHPLPPPSSLPAPARPGSSAWLHRLTSATGMAAVAASIALRPASSSGGSAKGGSVSARR